MSPLYVILAAGAAVLGYEIYKNMQPPKGSLGFLVIPAGANVLEPDGTVQTLSVDTPSSELQPGSYIGGAGSTDYFVMSDGSISPISPGGAVTGHAVLPTGTTIMLPDGTNKDLTADTPSSSLPAGTAVFEEGHIFVVANDGSLHQSQAV